MDLGSGKIWINEQAGLLLPERLQTFLFELVEKPRSAPVLLNHGPAAHRFGPVKNQHRRPVATC